MDARPKAEHDGSAISSASRRRICLRAFRPSMGPSLRWGERMECLMKTETVRPGESWDPSRFQLAMRSNRSSQPALALSMSWTFHARFHALIARSRAKADARVS